MGSMENDHFTRPSLLSQQRVALACKSGNMGTRQNWRDKELSLRWKDTLRVTSTSQPAEVITKQVTDGLQQ